MNTSPRRAALAAVALGALAVAASHATAVDANTEVTFDVPTSISISAPAAVPVGTLQPSGNTIFPFRGQAPLDVQVTSFVGYSLSAYDYTSTPLGAAFSLTSAAAAPAGADWTGPFAGIGGGWQLELGREYRLGTAATPSGTGTWKLNAIVEARATADPGPKNIFLLFRALAI